MEGACEHVLARASSFLEVLSHAHARLRPRRACCVAEADARAWRLEDAGGRDGAVFGG